MVTVLADSSLYEFTGGEAPDLTRLEERYRRLVQGPADLVEIWLNWIARRHVDDRTVGFVQASVTDDGADVAWLIGVEFQGQALATEAASAMLDWLVEHGVRRLIAHIHPFHVASQRVAQHIGLVLSDEVDDDGEELWVRECEPTD